ncbi:MAG: methyltransferase domain-containing protein [bacterium]|nr:methyltransferase domain-containing protein [bacterium]MCP4133994.1 methyltransferase domain-containing protein [bacterium]
MTLQHDYFYLERLREHGRNSPHSVALNTELQDNLFDIITGILPGKNPGQSYSLLDVGSGLGDFAGYLHQMGYGNLEYLGIDIIPEMVELARRKYPEFSFCEADFTSPAFKECFDFVTCSGALNVINRANPDEHYSYLKNCIKKMYDLSRAGTAFNLLSIRGEEYFTTDDQLFYTDPDEIFDFCKSFCKRVVLDHEYYEYTFTIFLHR